MLNLHELQVFLVAAETENFSETGRHLSLSQPAVSMQIRSLEKQLGVDLFYRAGRHIRLTEAGHALIPMARGLVNQSIQVEEAMASLQHGEVIGLLKIGCSTTVGKYILPRLIAGLRNQHPLVRVQCHVSKREDALQWLLNGEAHIAMSSLQEPLREIEYRPFLVDRIVLIARPDHRWGQNGGVITPEELLEENFILREPTAGTYIALRNGLAEFELSPLSLKNVMTLENSEAIRMAVQEKIGVAFVSGLVATDAIQAGSLISIKVEGLDLYTTLYLARHTGRPATRAQTAFWEFAFAPENEALRQMPEPFIDLETPPGQLAN
jgi:DNA-binding transcriptional LysR family regulator